MILGNALDLESSKQGESWALMEDEVTDSLEDLPEFINGIQKPVRERPQVDYLDSYIV